MLHKDFFEDITNVINDWKNTTFTFNAKTYVPGLDDPSLTYGNGEEKKGVEINTCVLFADIRNSVQLTKDKQIRTMGRIYSVFTHCVLLAAQYEGGYVRNIIGDRVMVVFPPDDCYKKAVHCAITINHIASLINQEFANFEFKCGIGVDYGKLSVMKVGIQKKGAENDDNKGLVWVGYPANFASRLTDCANKEFTDVVYNVDGEFYELSLLTWPLEECPFGEYHRKQKKFTEEELSSKLRVSQYSQNLELPSCRKVYSIKKSIVDYRYKPILLSDKVYQEFAKVQPNSNSIKNGWWKKEKRRIKDIEFDVWGAGLTWVL